MWQVESVQQKFVKSFSYIEFNFNFVFVAVKRSTHINVTLYTFMLCVN